jgi:hypothetical protein
MLDAAFLVSSTDALFFPVGQDIDGRLESLTAIVSDPVVHDDEKIMDPQQKCSLVASWASGQYFGCLSPLEKSISGAPQKRA